MESWRNRKTLILSRTDMMGLLTPADYVACVHMAEGTLATCNEVFAWEEVRVWSRTQATLDHFIASQQPKFPKLKRAR
jgi:hypothetical protein